MVTEYRIKIVKVDGEYQLKKYKEKDPSGLTLNTPIGEKAEEIVQKCKGLAVLVGEIDKNGIEFIIKK